MFPQDIFPGRLQAALVDGQGQSRRCLDAAHVRSGHRKGVSTGGCAWVAGATTTTAAATTAASGENAEHRDQNEGSEQSSPLAHTPGNKQEQSGNSNRPSAARPRLEWRPVKHRLSGGGSCCRGIDGDK